MGLQKVSEQGKDENTRKLAYYGNTVEKKDKKTTLHLLHILVHCNASRNRHSVVFLSFFSIILPQQQCNKKRLQCVLGRPYMQLTSCNSHIALDQNMKIYSTKSIHLMCRTFVYILQFLSYLWRKGKKEDKIKLNFSHSIFQTLTKVSRTLGVVFIAEQ